jgi:hypothetical protein
MEHIAIVKGRSGKGVNARAVKRARNAEFAQRRATERAEAVGRDRRRVPREAHLSLFRPDFRPSQPDKPQADFR